MDNITPRTNRPGPRHPDFGPAPQSATPHQPHHKPSHAPKPRRKLLVVGIILAVLVAAVAAWYLLGRTSTSSAIDSSKHQAVFFTNGQVYFGKLSELNDDYMRLKDVYYLQNKEQAADETSPQSASAQDASNVELIKLGNEIHGPEDEMLVAKDQVLFFENLKPAGTVSKTITEFQQK